MRPKCKDTAPSPARQLPPLRSLAVKNLLLITVLAALATACSGSSAGTIETRPIELGRFDLLSLGSSDALFIEIRRCIDEPVMAMEVVENDIGVTVTVTVRSNGDNCSAERPTLLQVPTRSPASTTAVFDGASEPPRRLEPGRPGDNLEMAVVPPPSAALFAADLGLGSATPTCIVDSYSVLTGYMHLPNFSDQLDEVAGGIVDAAGWSRDGWLRVTPWEGADSVTYFATVAGEIVAFIQAHPESGHVVSVRECVGLNAWTSDGDPSSNGVFLGSQLP